MKILASGLALLVSSCHNVQPPLIPQHDPYGEQIQFHADPEDYHKTGQHGAVAKYIDGTPFVFYNPDWFNSMPEEMQSFFFQHEVAHFHLKHVRKKPYFASKKQRMLMERQADCYSIKYLRNKLHYTPKQLEKVIELADFQLEKHRVRNLPNCFKK